MVWYRPLTHLVPERNLTAAGLSAGWVCSSFSRVRLERQLSTCKLLFSQICSQTNCVVHDRNLIAAELPIARVSRPLICAEFERHLPVKTLPPGRVCRPLSCMVFERHLPVKALPSGRVCRPLSLSVICRSKLSRLFGFLARSPTFCASFSFLRRDNLWFRRRLEHGTERRMQRVVPCRTDVCPEKICTGCREGGVRLDVVETRGGGGAGDGAGGPLDLPKVRPKFSALVLPIAAARPARSHSHFFVSLPITFA